MRHKNHRKPRKAARSHSRGRAVSSVKLPKKTKTKKTFALILRRKELPPQITKTLKKGVKDPRAQLRRATKKLQKEAKSTGLKLGNLLRRKRTQAKHAKAYKHGKKEGGRRAWNRRDPRLPDYLFYYHGD